MRFFISSTYIDLVEYRAYTIEYLKNLTSKKTGSIAAMEYFVASDTTSKEVCLAELEKCDIVIGIYGTRFGWEDDETGRSMTEIEFDRAVELGKPILGFVTYSEQEPIQKEFIHNKVFARGKNCGRFNNLTEYADVLHETIKQYFKDTEGYSYESLWEEIKQIREAIARDPEQYEMHMEVYKDGDEEKAIKMIEESVKYFQDLETEIYQMFYFCTCKEEAKLPVDFYERLNDRWEYYFLGYENRLTSMRLAVSFLKVSQLQHRLLTEVWTDNLRQKVIRARTKYLRIAWDSYAIE